MRFRRTFKQQVLTAAEIERRLYGAPLPEINKLPPALSGGALEAKEIINKLIVERDNANQLIEKELVSFDSKVGLEAVVGYIEALLERINQEGKV